jgi:hypothetical protein
MSKNEPRRESGSKLTRSETVTVRLDPKLRYLADLAARKHRRTLSSFIEWAVEASLRGVKLYQGSGYNGDDDITVDDESSQLWDVDDSERFARLAIKYPELLTHQEQEIWKLLQDSGLFLSARFRDSNGMVFWDWAILEDMVFPMLRRHWSELMTVYSESMEAARKWVDKTESDVSNGKIYPIIKKNETTKTTAVAFDDFDDNIPF